MPQIGSGYYSGFEHMAYCFKVMLTQQSENMYLYSESYVFIRINLLLKY